MLLLINLTKIVNCDCKKKQTKFIKKKWHFKLLLTSANLSNKIYQLNLYNFVMFCGGFYFNLLAAKIFVTS